MWKLTGFNEGSVPTVYPQAGRLPYSAKSTNVEAELCRDPKCPVRHIFPVDVVFSVSNKGPLKQWTLREEDTSEKRHMSELMAQADADASRVGIPAENVWSGLQTLMQKSGTHLRPGELYTYRKVIEQRLLIRQLYPCESDCLIEGTAEIYTQVFEHLMFDNAYFEALRLCIAIGTTSQSPDQRRSPLFDLLGLPDSHGGTEHFLASDTCPIVPGRLTPELRAQWIEDFTRLTSYAMEKGYGAKVKTTHKSPTYPSKAPSPTPPTKADAQREANKQLYQANKVLASTNAATEAKLKRLRITLGSLTTKMEGKTGEKVDDPEPIERVSAALRLLLLSQSENNGDNKENDSGEVTLLSAQLQKLNAANATLQTELVGLQDQLKEVRHQKKDRVKPEKKK